MQIKSMEGLFGRDETKDFEKFNLKKGDIIEVYKLASNAYWYQPIPKGEVLMIYSHNLTTPPLKTD